MWIDVAVNVLELLPQRPPFIMVDKLTYYDPKHAKTIFLVRSDNIFSKNGVMEEAGLVENIAQTCAARTGYKQRFDTISATDNKVKIGVIASIDLLEIKRNPLVGEMLETSMTIEEEFFSTTLVKSEVQIASETIAICRMKLFLTDKIPDS